MNSFISFLVLTWIVSTAFGQNSQIVTGPCSRFQVTNQQPFFKKLLMGKWYIYATFDYADIVGLDCVADFYRLTPDGNAMSTEIGKNLTTNEWKTVQSVYRFDKPGVGYYVYLQGSEDDDIQIPITDYIHYYIEFDCVDLADGKSDCYIGVFTRLPFPSAITVAKINEYVDAHHIDRSKLRYIVHDRTKCTL